VQNGTTPVFKGTGPWRMAIPEATSIFSVCMHILHFWTFGWCLNSNLNYGYSSTLQNLWGEILALKCGTLETTCMSEWSAPSTLAHSARTADLTYISSERTGCRTAPLHFSKVRGLKEWPYLRLHQFSRCACMYCIFLDIWMMFEFKFEPWVHQVHFKLSRGKYPPQGVEP
jgi:hypothetical protein